MVKDGLAFLGLVAAIGLSILDFVTSIMGIQGIIGQNKSMILMVVPFLVAMLALAFNACSSYILKSAAEEQLTGFSKLFLLFCWFGCLSFDAGSSFIGLVEALNEKPISSLPEAMQEIGHAKVVLALSVATLATTGPFLAVTFAQITSRGNSMFASISKMFD